MTLHRNIEISGAVRADGSGEYTFSLSSEEPYLRWDGYEILDHDPESVDLSFLNSGNAPLLDTHNRYDLDSQLGVITRAWIDQKRLYVSVKFSNRPRAQAVRQDVDDGIVRNVSVGYDIPPDGVEREDGADEYRVIRWTPKEASFVPVPADSTVGIGRSDTTMEGHTMPPIDTPARTLPGLETPQTEEQRAESLQTAISEITALAAEHNRGDMARAFIEAQIREGREPSLTLFKGIVQADLPDGTPLRNENIGLTGAETRQFSVLRLARHLAEPSNPQFQREAAFEIAACDAASEVAEVNRGGRVVPADLMNSWGDFEFDGVRSTDPRVRAAMSTSANANVQNTEHLAARFIDNLRNALVLGRLGVTMLPGLSGNIEIPGGDANTGAAWLASEDANATESNPSFRLVSMSIHDVASYTDLTRRMLIQSTIAIEQYVRAQLVRAMAEKIDLAGFYGAGSGGVPEGLANTSGIGSVTFAAAVPTRSELIDMDAAIMATNQVASPTMVMDTTMSANLRKTKVDAGSGVFLMSNGDTLEIGNSVARSNQITSGDVFAGVFSDMFMGMWGSLELDRSTEAKFLSGGIRLRAIQSVDFGVARVGSFALGNDD